MSAAEKRKHGQMIRDAVGVKIVVFLTYSSFKSLTNVGPSRARDPRVDTSFRGSAETISDVFGR